jgi:hypothetical protein
MFHPPLLEPAVLVLCCVSPSVPHRVAPNHFVRGSGSVARAALKALEAVKVVKQGANGYVLEPVDPNLSASLLVSLHVCTNVCVVCMPICMHMLAVNCVLCGMVWLCAIRLVVGSTDWLMVVCSGRILTKTGRRDLDRIAGQITL